MGIVYEATREDIPQLVAIKFLPGSAASEVSRQRFDTERRVLMALNHPNIVSAYDTGLTPETGEPYLVMRRIPGQSLQNSIQELHQKHPPETDPLQFRAALEPLLRSLLAVCQAMSYAHSQGFLHRDLKPSNIMVGEFGETVVVDWGVAKVLHTEPDQTTVSTADHATTASQTVSGSSIGTPGYISPEQQRGESLDPRADVFSMGATLTAILSGGSPTRDLVPSPAIPRSLLAVARKARAADRSQRYSSVSEFNSEITRYLHGESVLADVEPWSERLERVVRSHPSRFAGLAVALIVGLLATAITSVWVSQLNQYLRAANTREAHARTEAETRDRESSTLVDEWFTAVSESPELKQTPNAQQFRLKLLERARDYYEARANRIGDNPETVQDVAMSHIKVATILDAIRPGELAVVEQAVSKYREAHRLAPTEIKIEVGLIGALNNLAVAHMKAGQQTSAERLLAEARERTGPLIEREESAETRNCLTRTMQNQGINLMDRDQLPQAVDTYIQLKLELQKSIALVPDQLNLLEDLGNSRLNAGLCLHRMNKLSEAQIACQESM
jgi:eukaryotic-like serine/threonine-protein kinase